MSVSKDPVRGTYYVQWIGYTFMHSLMKEVFSAIPCQKS